MGGLSKREKIMLIILAIAVGGFLYYNYILTPQLKNLKAADDKLQESRTKLASLQVQEKNIDTLKKEIEDLTAKADEATKSIPDTDRIPELIIYLRDMTSNSGCTTGTLGFGSPQSLNVESDKSNGAKDQNSSQSQNLPGNVTSGVVVILPMTYQVSGSYADVMSMLKYMENNQRKMMVSSLAITKDQQQGKKGTSLTATITFNSLYRMLGDPSQPINYPFSNIPVGKVDLFN